LGATPTGREVKSRGTMTLEKRKDRPGKKIQLERAHHREELVKKNKGKNSKE